MNPPGWLKASREKHVNERRKQYRQQQGLEVPVSDDV